MSTPNDQATAVFHLLQELGKIIRIFQNEAVMCEGVTFAQYCILDHAAARGGRIEMSDLHGLLAVEKSTTTRMVAPLVRRGLVARHTSGHDSRARELVLTPKGQEIHDKVTLCVTGFLNNVLGNIPDDRRKGIIDSLGAFIGSVRSCCGGAAGCDCM